VQYQAVKAKDFVVTLDYGIAEVARLFERRQPSGRGFDCAFVRFHVAPLKLQESTRDGNTRAIGKPTNEPAFANGNDYTPTRCRKRFSVL